MKLFKYLLMCVLVFTAPCNDVIAGSLNGTVTPIYATAHQIFHNANAVTGFVRINNGFSVAPAETVLFDTFITVSGGIDLKDTGILSLNNHLRLESGVTLTTGGIIAGRGHAVALGDNLTLTSTTNVRVLHIRSDTIIDGRGNSFIIGDRAQIFVDTNVTLTLRDIVLKTGSFSKTPPIRLASLGSKLALDNAVLELGSDFAFKQGQIFFHNDVIVTGTSAFIYSSPRPSYIIGKSTLTFDKGTTFSVAPSTFTDALFSSIPTTTTNNFVIMQDASSTLFMNGSNLSITNTGLRLTQGNLFFNNRVALNTCANTQLSTTPFSPVGSSIVTGTNPFSVSWSPNGRFIAVINNGSSTLQVYEFDGTNTPFTIGGAVTTGSSPYSVAWSPDGRFIAVANSGSSSFQIYSFNGNSSPVAVGGAASTSGSTVSITWSPDGNYIGIVIFGSSLKIYRFDGVNTPTLVGSVATGTASNWLSWSPEGRYIAVILYSGQAIQVFSFDGINAPVAVGNAVPTTSFGLRIAWSPDGRYIAAGGVSNENLYVYSFRGTTQPTLIGTITSVPGGVQGLSWSPDGRYILTGGSSSLQLYKFDGSSTPVAVGGTISVTSSVRDLAWSSDGNFVAIVSSSSNVLQVYKANYASPSTTQGFTTSLVLGNSSIGSSANLNTRFLGGAHVEVSGSIYDDSV